MQKAIISHPAKAFRQDMLKDKPKEVFPFEGAGTDVAGAAFDIFKGDMAIFIGNDVVFGDDAPV
mgnify:CR=1 FL=1